MRDNNILLRKIGSVFSDHSLLHIALTHSSAANEIKSAPTDSNERLEFLGDSLIGLVIANELFCRLPEQPEGYLTELRSYLVSRETLASVAKQISLGDYILLGQGEKHTGGQHRDSNLSSGFEALMGAILLDQGFDKAYSVVAQLLSKEIGEVVENGVEKDPKSYLQELTQSLGKGTPKYVLVQQTSGKHNRAFVVEIMLGTEVIGKGDGPRKLDAERIAATNAIESLRLRGFDNI